MKFAVKSGLEKTEKVMPLSRRPCTPCGSPLIIINNQNRIAAHMTKHTEKSAPPSTQNLSTVLTDRAQPAAQPDAHQPCCARLARTLRTTLIFRLLLLMFLCTPSVPAVAASCLHYGGSLVTLSGTVKLQTFFGPPNYGENPDTDSRETQAILLLTKPICVEANSAEDEEAEQNQLEVTLVPFKKQNLKNYEGKKIVVQGTLYHAHTGHHHTPVLIEIKRIKNVSK